MSATAATATAPFDLRGNREAKPFPVALPLHFAASPRVAERLAALGRTEDLQFSPDQRRLAICGYLADRILVLAFAATRDGDGGLQVSAEASVEIACPAFSKPHGLAWLDAATLAVANRSGGLQIVPVPAAAADAPTVTVAPLLALPGDGTQGVRTPGSVAVARRGDGRFDLFACNNYDHSVARVRIARDGAAGGFRLLETATLLARGLDVPDGVALPPRGRVVAISNHVRQRVDIYRLTPWTSARTRSAARLMVAGYPHGLCFAAGGRLLLVADAGAPVVHVFRRAAWTRWRGRLQPALSVRVMDDATFRRGSRSPQDGGPKGVDLSGDGSLLALTCQEVPLAFFDGALFAPPTKRSGFPQRLRARHP